MESLHLPRSFIQLGVINELYMVLPHYTQQKVDCQKQWLIAFCNKHFVEWDYKQFKVSWAGALV